MVPLAEDDLTPGMAGSRIAPSQVAELVEERRCSWPGELRGRLSGLPCVAARRQEADSQSRCRVVRIPLLPSRQRGISCVENFPPSCNCCRSSCIADGVTVAGSPMGSNPGLAVLYPPCPTSVSRPISCFPFRSLGSEQGRSDLRGQTCLLQSPPDTARSRVRLRDSCNQSLVLRFASGFSAQ